jgi:DNA-binding response OmpR family regulator
MLSIKEKNMHILVVEDEQRLAHLLRRVLLEERHTVDLAHDGQSGLDLALSDTYIDQGSAKPLIKTVRGVGYKIET